MPGKFGDSPQANVSGRELQELADWMWVRLVYGMCSYSAVCDVRRCGGSAGRLREVLLAGNTANFEPSVCEKARMVTLDEARRFTENCMKDGCGILTMNSPLYPEILRMIPVPPLVLFTAGNQNILETELAVGVVGARHPSAYTVDVETDMLGALCRELGDLNIQITSGFAAGVDAAAHHTALKCGKSTTAVLGCGLDISYPSENYSLRRDMLDSGRGLFITEFFPGTSPLPVNFPKRNRILCGISHVITLFEASIRSGSLNSAGHALEQGKPICVLPPHDVRDPRYAGVFSLLRDGAYPMMTAQDIIRVVLEQLPQQVPADRYLRPSNSAVYAAEAITQADIHRPRQKASPKKTEEPENLPEAPLFRLEAAMEPQEGISAQIYRYLRENGATRVNDLADALQTDMAELLSELTALELEGLVEANFGQRYSIVE